MNGFDNNYFKAYAYFDAKQNKNSCYTNKSIRLAGNHGVPYTIYSIYKKLFNADPKTYIDIGCGTGEEMAFYKNKGCKVQGCDFSDYALKNKNSEVSKFIKNKDAQSFINSYTGKADIVFESVCQYINEKECSKLYNSIYEKTSDNCIIGIIFDHTHAYHPYKKQQKTIKQWKLFFENHGFINIEKFYKKLPYIKESNEYVSPYIYIKDTSSFSCNFFLSKHK